jgi:adenine-specific DNA-methyltransferase
MTQNRKRPIKTYVHTDKQRLNNPPVGLVTPETDKDAGRALYSYDPHLDPQLVWAGKAEHTSFEVPTVSLHVHERIDPHTIIEAVKMRNGSDPQLSFFSSPEENPPIREAIEFYRHKHNWTNRLIAGDSLLVMNSLLEKEGMAGQVQMVYVDPPYGIKYKSNFQPFTNKRGVAESDKDDDLTQEPEMLKAFRDTWELGIHSFVSYVRDRLLLAKGLLHESGSVFVQISDENLHLIRNLLDEVFGPENFIALIAFKKKKMPLGETFIFTMCDYIVWYGRSRKDTKFRRLFAEREFGLGTDFSYVDLGDGRCLTVTECLKQLGDVPKNAKYFQSMDMRSSGRTEGCVFEYTFDGRKFFPSGGKSWKTNEAGMKRLESLGRLFAPGDSLRYKYYFDDYPVMELSHMWMDTQGATDMTYVVQTSEKVVQRCLLMTTDPGDLVFDPTCGSGTTAVLAEQWGRRWITCDSSRIALTLAKQRIMTSVYPFYQMAHPSEGVQSGFMYRTAAHLTLGSLTGDEPSQDVTLYDQPIVDTSRVRVSGPFTVEAVPAPVVRAFEDVAEDHAAPRVADRSIVRSGETQRQSDWRDELLKTGIRAKGGQRIVFARVEPLAGTRWLHADAETNEEKPQRVVASFGPEYAPLEQRQVALALEEAQQLVPKPKIVVFAAFQFDPEAAKDIDETNWAGVTLIKAQMNADLLTEDLKKKRASNESFWLIGQPDIEVTKITKGNQKGKYQVAVNGFDYYNTKTGDIESGGADKIAMWLLDPNYDGRSLFPRQVFFPMSGTKDGWSRLAASLNAEIDLDLVRAYGGAISLAFSAGSYKRAAVKIVDDRGIESFRVIGLE